MQMPVTLIPFPSRAGRVPVLSLSTRILALLALVGANAIWGASAVASKAVLAHIPPLTMASLRVAIALAVLLPLVARTGHRPTRGGTTALLGLSGVTLFCVFQNVGLGFASATTTALINGGIPVLTALLAVTFLGERLTMRRLAGLLAASSGVIAIALLGTGAGPGTSALGNLLPIAGAVSFAAYAVLGRRAFTAGNALSVVAGSTRYGLLFLLPGAGFELATVGLGPVTAQDVLLLLYLGVGCSALAFVLCGYGLARLEAGEGAVFGNLKPLVGVVLAGLLLGESVTTGHLGGGALVLLGVLLASGEAPLERAVSIPSRPIRAQWSGRIPLPLAQSGFSALVIGPDCEVSTRAPPARQRQCPAQSVASAMVASAAPMQATSPSSATRRSAGQDDAFSWLGSGIRIAVAAPTHHVQTAAELAHRRRGRVITHRGDRLCP